MDRRPDQPYHSNPDLYWLAAAFGLIVVAFLGIVTAGPHCWTRTPAERLKLIETRARILNDQQVTVLVGDVGPIVCDLHPE